MMGDMAVSLTEREKAYISVAADRLANDGVAVVCFLERTAERLIETLERDGIDAVMGKIADAIDFIDADVDAVDDPFVMEMRAVIDFMAVELQTRMTPAEILAAGKVAFKEKRMDVQIIPGEEIEEMNDETGRNIPPLKIYGEFIPGLLEATGDELAAILRPLMAWHSGREYTRPSGLLGLPFDALKASAERAEEHRKAFSEAGRRGGERKSRAKTETARANGRKGGRPHKNPSQTQAKPKHGNDNGNGNGNGNDTHTSVCVKEPHTHTDDILSYDVRAACEALQQIPRSFIEAKARGLQACDGYLENGRRIEPLAFRAHCIKWWNAEKNKKRWRTMDAEKQAIERGRVKIEELHKKLFGDAEPCETRTEAEPCETPGLPI